MAADITVDTGGMQYYLLTALYLRGAVGTGTVSDSTTGSDVSRSQGVGLEGGLGYEIVRDRHAAVGLEANASTTRYAQQSWQTAGLSLAFTIF